MPARRRTPRVSKHASRMFYTVIAFLAIGFFPTFLTFNPVLAMGMAAGLMAFFAFRAPSVLTGVLRGLVLGAVAGVAMAGAVHMRFIADIERRLAEEAASSQPASRPASGPATAPTTAPATAPATRPASQPTTHPALDDLDFQQIYLICVGGTAAMCAAAGMVFAYFAQRRRRRIDQEWQ